MTKLCPDFLLILFWYPYKLEIKIRSADMDRPETTTLDRDFCHTKDTKKRQRSEKLSGNFSVCALISKKLFYILQIWYFTFLKVIVASTIVHCPVTVSKQTINLYPIPSCRNIQRLQMLCIRCAIFIVKSALDYMISWFCYTNLGM